MSEPLYTVPVNTGNPQMDQQQIQQYEQQYRASGMTVQTQPSPTGGYVMKVWAAGQGPGAMGGAPMGGPMGGAPMGGAPMGGPPMGGAPMGGAPMGGPMGGAPMGGGMGAMAGGMAGKVAGGLGIMRILQIVGGVLFFAAAGAAGCWFYMHPDMYVDNAGAAALEVFVDGKKVATVGADSHKRISISTGSKTFGYGPAGSKKPEQTIKAKISGGKKYLFNPGKTACYWLQVDTYGRASDAGHKWGPQPIKEVYEFGKVDNWFKENPSSVKTKKKGEVKIALQRAKVCMKLQKCPLPVREALMTCSAAAAARNDESGFDACTKIAVQACGGGG